ncbi:helix-turn-helix transcriptional regulator [Hymenobacter monticola]|uniref:WYL domain-containing protein n=2 Tax=Hymenobacter TaxID=89966 RepID=A0ABY4BBT4_9BACT|nr:MULTISPECIES: WYL domain-containing protein [Hymenobacter]MDU0372342.1 WYL domain-containing protein [Hymenobacter endophyticus]UOE36619.1 WYL domain-containing protein [Hymenobacter monticola]
MPTNKNAQNRYIIIDTCLRRRNRVWTIEDLLQAVSDDYVETTAAGSGVCMRTLKEDLHNMRLPTHYNAPIKYTRRLGYHYSDPEYSIFKSSLTSEDLVLLHQSLHTLKALRGLGLTDDLDELIQRLERQLPSISAAASPILQLEAAPDYTGTPYLKPLYLAIRDKTPLVVHYQSYRAAQTTPEEVHPYLLKAYNGRWYLIGFNEAKGPHLQNYALDRIKQLTGSQAAFRTSDVDFSTYYESIIGVTIPEQSAGVETIRLHIAAGRAPYVRTKALHASQVILHDTAAGLEIELRLIINQELKTLLLSFGPDLRVLEPSTLRSSMKRLLRKAALNYE